MIRFALLSVVVATAALRVFCALVSGALPGRAAMGLAEALIPPRLDGGRW
jgi:hypothetical protein